MSIVTAITFFLITSCCLCDQKSISKNDYDEFVLLMQQTGTITLTKKYNLIIDTTNTPFTPAFQHLVGNSETPISIEGSNTAIFGILNSVTIENVTINIKSTQTQCSPLIRQIINSNLVNVMVNITQPLSINNNINNCGIISNSITNSNLKNVGILFNNLDITLQDATNFFGLISSTYESTSATNECSGIYIKGNILYMYYTKFGVSNFGFYFGESRNLVLNNSFVDIDSVSINAKLALYVGMTGISYFTNINYSFILIKNITTNIDTLYFGAFSCLQYGDIFISNTWVEINLYNSLQKDYIYISGLIVLMGNNINIHIYNVLINIFIHDSYYYITALSTTSINNNININKLYINIINKMDININIHDIMLGNNDNPIIYSNSSYYTTSGSVIFESINNKTKYINNRYIPVDLNDVLEFGMNKTIKLRNMPYYYNNKYYGCNINIPTITIYHDNNCPIIIQLTINPQKIIFNILKYKNYNINISINNINNNNIYIIPILSNNNFYNTAPSPFFLQPSNYSHTIQLYPPNIFHNDSTNIIFNLSNDYNEVYILQNNTINITFIYYSLIKPPNIQLAFINSTHHYIQIIFNKNCYMKDMNLNIPFYIDKFITFDKYTRIRVDNYIWKTKKELIINYDPNNTSFNQFLIIHINCGFIFNDKDSIYSTRESHLIPTNTSIDDDFDSPLVF